jgi:hypothetical protein
MLLIVVVHAAPSHAAQVYECKVNGQRIFSDQPCAADAAKREVTESNTMSAREANIGYRSSAIKTTDTKRQRSAEADHTADKRLARCAKLNNDKLTVNSKLRAGYKNNEGERLRDRLRKLDGEYYDLRCSSLR